MSALHFAGDRLRLGNEQIHASMICNCARLALSFDKTGCGSAMSKFMQS